MKRLIDLPVTMGVWGISLPNARLLIDWLNQNPYNGACLELGGEHEDYRFEIQHHNSREVIEVRDRKRFYSPTGEVGYVEDIDDMIKTMVPQIQKARKR